MSSYDSLFVKILSSPEFEKIAGADARRCESIAKGKKSLNKNVRALAEVVGELGKRISEAKSNGGGNITDSIHLDNSEMQSVYRKVVSLLSK